MTNFRDFLNECGYHVPVVSISKDKIDLSDEKTRDELNRTLDMELSREWTNPYCGLIKIRKIMDLYGVSLPKVILDDEMEGETVIVLNQFGPKFGADLSGNISTPNKPENDELYLVYEYLQSVSGFFKSQATIVTEDELNAMFDETGDEQFEDEESD